MESLAEAVRATIAEQETRVAALQQQIATKRQLYAAAVARLHRYAHATSVASTHQLTPPLSDVVLRPLFAQTAAAPPPPRPPADQPSHGGVLSAWDVVEARALLDEARCQIAVKVTAINTSKDTLSGVSVEGVLCAPVLVQQTSSVSDVAWQVQPGQTCTLCMSMQLPMVGAVFEHTLSVSLALAYDVAADRRHRQLLPTQPVFPRDRVLSKRQDIECGVRLSRCTLRLYPLGVPLTRGDFFKLAESTLTPDMCFQLVERATAQLDLHNASTDVHVTVRADAAEDGLRYSVSLASTTDAELCHVARRLIPRFNDGFLTVLRDDGDMWSAQLLELLDKLCRRARLCCDASADFFVSLAELSLYVSQLMRMLDRLQHVQHANSASMTHNSLRHVPARRHSRSDKPLRDCGFADGFGGLGGNQRDLARAKNLKKQQEQAKGRREDGATVTQRKENDAEIMRRKQQEAAAKKAATGGSSAPASSSKK
ncbi:hypothetical protein RI367_002298 [Sorochytrium milnesiophthora]